MKRLREINLKVIEAKNIIKRENPEERERFFNVLEEIKEIVSDILDDKNK